MNRPGYMMNAVRPPLVPGEPTVESITVPQPRMRKLPRERPANLKGYTNPIHPPKAASAPVQGRTKLVPTARGYVLGYAGFGILLIGSGYIVTLAASAFS
jgi:hypothetical protein